MATRQNCAGANQRLRADTPLCHDRAMRRPMLRREIAVLLTIKLIALAGLWYFFFRPELKVRVDPPAVEQHLFDPGNGAPGNGS